MDDKDFERYKNVPLGHMSRQEREAFLREAEKRRKQNQREEAAWQTAEREAGKKLDRMFEEDLAAMFGATPEEIHSDIDKAIRKNPTDKEVQEAAKAIADANKALQGGIFSSGNPKKARNIIRKNKNKIKNARKKGRGCAVIAFLLVSGIGGVLYGAYEGVTALASALF